MRIIDEFWMLMDAKRDSARGERLDVLVTLVDAYEAKNDPMDLPDPIDAIKFRMEQKGLTPKDLEPIIGKLNRVHGILKRTRPLTLKMICRLRRNFHIPADSLIRPADMSEPA
jgi:HTH-type transcriptional regulator/antitoxin HigA